MKEKLDLEPVTDDVENVEEKGFGFIGAGRFQVNMDDLLEVLKTGALAAAAAFVAFVIQNLGKVEMGEGMLVFLPMLTVALNAALNWLKDKQVA